MLLKRIIQYRAFVFAPVTLSKTLMDLRYIWRHQCGNIFADNVFPRLEKKRLGSAGKPDNDSFIINDNLCITEIFQYCFLNFTRINHT